MMYYTIFHKIIDGIFCITGYESHSRYNGNKTKM